MDVSPKYAGILLGCGNTIGNFAGILVNLSTGMILDACLLRAKNKNHTSSEPSVSLPLFFVSISDCYQIDQAPACIHRYQMQMFGSICDRPGPRSRYEDDLSAGWTVVFTTQIAVTCCGWLGFTLFYPSEGGVLIR